MRLLLLGSYRRVEPDSEEFGGTAESLDDAATWDDALARLKSFIAEQEAATPDRKPFKYSVGFSDTK